MAKSKLTTIVLMTFLIALFYGASIESFIHGSSSPDNWLMFHHDLTHTGYSTSTPTATFVTLLWNYTTNSVVWASPIIVDGRVYIPSDDGIVYCLDAISGDQIWNYTTHGTGRRGAPIGSSAAFSEGYIYFGSYDRNIYCLNAYTGVRVWNFTTGNTVESCPSVANLIR